MLLDAIVLAGGRSSRLSGEPKSGLVVDGETLLERTVDAASDARHVAVVGDPAALPPTSLLSPRVLLTRESPEFAGPAAGIAAGLAVLDALGTDPAAGILVLACDMPGVASAVETLLASTSAGATGSIAVDADAHPQFLAAVYPRHELVQAVVAHADGLEGLSVRSLVEGIALAQVRVPVGSTDDVDTWADAARLGAARAGEGLPVGTVAPATPARPATSVASGSRAASASPAASATPTASTPPAAVPLGAGAPTLPPQESR